MSAQRPGIPAVTNLSNELTRVLQPMKENIDISNGLADWQRQSVSLGMLVSVGVLTEQQAKQIARNET